ncbi:MAG: hypothetical protein AAB267_07575, partial [Candidatus Desantisbacteria bacterium]
NNIVVLSAPPGSFTLETEHHGTETAGEPFFVSITAADTDKFGNKAGVYSGSRTICWWNSIDGRALSTTKEVEFLQGHGTATGFILTSAQSTFLFASDTTNNICGTTNLITVKPSTQLHHLQIITEHNGTETAGATFTVKLIACDRWNNPTEHTGTESIFWSWDAATSTNGIPPTLPTSGSWTFKAGSVTIGGVKITNVASTVIHAQFGTISGTSTPIIVSPGQAASFKITAPATVTVDAPFNLISIAAHDPYGNTATTYIDTHTLTCNGTDTDVYFESGVSTSLLSMTLTTVGSTSISVHDGSITGTSASIIVKLGSTTSIEVSTEHQGTETAGKTFAIILQLHGGNSSYTGSLPVNWSWTVSNSPNNSTPTLPKDGTTSVVFSQGKGTVSGFILPNAAQTLAC